MCSNLLSISPAPSLVDFWHRFCLSVFNKYKHGGKKVVSYLLFWLLYPGQNATLTYEASALPLTSIYVTLVKNNSSHGP